MESTWISSVGTTAPTELTNAARTGSPVLRAIGLFRQYVVLDQRGQPIGQHIGQHIGRDPSVSRYCEKRVLQVG